MDLCFWKNTAGFKRPGLWVCAGIAAAIFFTYGRVVFHPFIPLDDHHYIYQNPMVRAGLTAKGLAWAFSSFEASNWHPATWIFHMADVEFFGLDAGMHHRVSLLMHAVNAILLFLVFRKMTGALFPSAVVAFLFSLHPLNVESVAWLSQRKTLLCAFFWILALGAYDGFARRPGRWRYLRVLLLFAASLMAKPLAVTFPCVLLLLDLWPLKRMRAGFRGHRELLSFKVSPLFLIYEKIPLLLLSAGSSLVTLAAQSLGGAVVPAVHHPLVNRLANAAAAYTGYVKKVWWPMDLAVFYPMRPVGASAVAALCFLVLISILVFSRYRRQPYLMVGWFWFIGALVPMIGIVQVGGQAMADRYAYLPTIGLFIMIAWGFEDLRKRFVLSRQWLVLPLAGLVALAAVTRHQSGYWKDGIILFEHALAVTENNATVHLFLGSQYGEKGDLDRSDRHFRQALAIKPDSADAFYGLGLNLEKKGAIKKAVAHLAAAIELRPDHADALARMGFVLQKHSRTALAIDYYRASLFSDPDNAEVHLNLAIALEQLGRPEKAAGHYRRALRLDPGLARGRQREK